MTDEKKAVTGKCDGPISNTQDALSKTQSHSASRSDRLQAPQHLPDTILAEVPHGANEVVRVSAREIRGQMRVDIRIWFRDDDGLWHPSSKGIPLFAREVPQLVSGMVRAASSINQSGAA